MAEAARVRKVVVVGRDDALWLTAHVLWRSFHSADVEVSVVELPSLLRSGDVYPTLKAQEGFHSLLGLDEGALMQATQATYSLGQRFANWSKARAPFIHGYSTYGKTINRVPFHQYWVKAHKAGLKAEFDDFSINAASIKQGRFFIPGADTDSFAICDYAYHLDAVLYCQVLKGLLRQRGVAITEGRVAETVRNGESGNITAVKLTNGQAVEADFFVDASGSEAVLIGRAFGTPTRSWKDWFPCDRLLTTFAAPLSPLPPFSHVAAFRSGWLGLYPLRNRTPVQQVYASVDMTDQEAYETAGMVSSMKFSPDAVVTSFEAGIRAEMWVKNCVAIGESACVLDPIDGARMHVNLIGLSHLVSLFPVENQLMPEREEYNRYVGASLERIRDYQLAHYKLNQRFDQPLWDHCRNSAVPDTLKYKLDLFAARGNLAMWDDETFQDDDWISLMIGHGLIPRAYDPLVDQMNEAEVIRQFQAMLGFIRMNVEKMKPMEAYLGQPIPGLVQGGGIE